MIATIVTHKIKAIQAALPHPVGGGANHSVLLSMSSDAPGGCMTIIPEFDMGERSGALCEAIVEAVNANTPKPKERKDP